MGGNVYQWNESLIGNGPAAGIRGASWNDFNTLSAASNRNELNPAGEVNSIGFRVASVGGVPEPSSGLLAALACGMIWCSRGRFKLA